MVALTYRRTSPADLTADEIDDNFQSLQDAINGLIDSPPTGREIVSITSDGRQLTFNMSDNTTIGPLYLPVLEFHWRGDWEATTSYDVLDIVRVAGIGLYLVNVNHTSAATFDRGALDVNGNAEYIELFEFAPAENVVYDLGFYYGGVLKDIPTSIDRIWEEPINRKVLLPVTPAAGSQHRIHLRVACSTAALNANLYQNSTVIGTVHVAVGANEGTVTINADVNFTAGSDLIGLGRQAVDDAVAGGMSLILAAQQVLG